MAVAAVVRYRTASESAADHTRRLIEDVLVELVLRRAAPVGIREGDPFCGPVAMRLGVDRSPSGRASVRSRP